MGISRTVSGLIYFDEFDSESGWTFEQYNQNYYAEHAIDTSEKHSGSGSSRVRSTAFDNGFLVMCKDINLGSGAGRRLSIWHKMATDVSLGCAAIVLNGIIHPAGFGNPDEEWIPGPNVLDYEAPPEAWTRHSHVLTLSGTNTVVVHGAGVRGHAYSWVDKLAIQQSDVLTVTGLVEAQKVELYRSSDDTKLDTQTCAAGETNIQFSDLSAEDCPCQMYFIIYATDGATLIETTPSYDMCGGDTWEWTADAGTITIASDVLIIYRGAASATPKTAAITANLKTIGGANYPGALIYFSASNGAISPSSDTTDANGNAHTTLSSLTNTQGIAIVKAQWLGDVNVPACSVYVTVHVFYEAEAPDSDMGFQLYIEGYPVSFVSGRYGVNAQGKPEDFEIEIPEWDDEIKPYGVVSIYRKGVQEFAGIYLKPERTLTDSPRVVLTGSDLTYLLSDKVCDLKIYSAKTPQYMIADLLTTFPCGITAGSLGSSPDSLTLTFDTENLLAAIQRICDNVYWNFRVNLDRTLDFAERFGGAPSGLTFVEGMDILSLDRTEDYAQLKNWVRMRGDGIVSTKQDGASIMEHGLHQATSFQRSISSQATLDAACQALVELLKDRAEMIPMEAIDGYPPGTFKSEDTVWVTSPTLDMNGEYTIKRIKRDMTDPDYVKFELSNRLIAYWELDEAYRRMVKDASVI